MEPLHGTEEVPKKVSNLKIFILLFVSFLTVIVLLALSMVWNMYQSMYRSMDISVLDKEISRSTFFYDRGGKVMAELTNAKIEYLPFDDFPKSMLDAVIAVEDARFYEHNGLDYYGIARAFYTNMKSGYTVQGGSTITQQLAKTMLFTSEQTYTRKLNEAVASIKIEKSYTKEQILERYLNHIYFGEGAWGLQRAAKMYFGKEASELSLAESALLAGIPKSPTYYSPVKKPDQSKERRNLVLSLMAEQGKITAQERDKAQKEEIKLYDKTAEKMPKFYSSYIDHAINEAIEKYGLTEEQILSSGLHIHTNMDPKVQLAAEEVYRNPSSFPEDKGGLQSGIVLMDPQTGAVLGIVGSRNPNQKFREFNYATQNERQPGSTFKPVLVYAPALSEGFGPKDLIHDEETDFGGGYKPMNYLKKFHGWVTLEEALVKSHNIPAVALLKEIGIDKGIDFAKKAGLPLQESDRVFGIALGGTSKGTSPLMMAQAYTMFANGGKIAKAYAITKITDSTGRPVGNQAEPVLEPVLDPNVAYTMTMMLQKAVKEGTGQNARMDRPVAGKTGTTQLPDIPEFKDPYGNQLIGSKDAWFVGYTPEIVAAVWLGYERTTKERYLNTTGGKYPASLFRQVVSKALQDTPVTNFTKPKSYVPIVGGTKHVNGDKKAMHALWLERQKQPKKAPRTRMDTPVIPAADIQQNTDLDKGVPDTMADSTEGENSSVETDGAAQAAVKPDTSNHVKEPLVGNKREAGTVSVSGRGAASEGVAETGGGAKGNDGTSSAAQAGSGTTAKPGSRSGSVTASDEGKADQTESDSTISGKAAAGAAKSEPSAKPSDGGSTSGSAKSVTGPTGEPSAGESDAAVGTSSQ
ncbi:MULTISPECIES: PBP1A family penicillin-binding protein [unclassified Paenibacillus]|uniref:PBP1A family penicillin-binding protein n=1 Tax=unclassified Paenibacillus TaxID=185978 RepID=UPI001AE719CC|nr:MULTISPECIES: PBP1A family penicillin-binding protein [unclassified Paenibacillus]MBP1154269.1 penicillin-binding protein 2A [Paenibacillus sp. PvP091]MBP1170346.1 penicillin-binding protein 2A [Paenibacillus sp. PvR098]MBP2441374.1 penicillin-binding protein 2A [Paenibacillus sp. PvP052]